MKNDTNQTSNHHPNNIISNILIRHQAKNKIDNSTSVERKTSYIHNIYDSIKNTQKNSVILLNSLRIILMNIKAI